MDIRKEHAIVIAAILVAAVVLIQAMDDSPLKKQGDGSPLDDSSGEDTDKYQVTYNGTHIQYSIVQTKPTPCHTIDVDETVFADDQIDILVNIVPSDQMCAQVITDETIEGSIEVGNPETVTIIVEGKVVYSKNLN